MSIDDYAALVDPAKMREVLLERRSQLASQLAANVLSYQLEEQNDALTGDERTRALAEMETRVKVVGKALQECDRRLLASEEALRG